MKYELNKTEMKTIHTLLNKELSELIDGNIKKGYYYNHLNNLMDKLGFIKNE